MNPGYIDPDYVDVAERIQLFYDRYPDGRLVTLRWTMQPVGERTFVACEAQAFRTVDDPHPAHGTAWEPIPGPTPFTKDSELMNAETAAWGRAIVAAGIPSKKIASADEVQARSGGGRDAAAPAPKEDKPRTDAQNRKIHALLNQLEQAEPKGDGQWKEYAREWTTAQFRKASSADLTTYEAGRLIDHLEALTVPFG